MDKLNAQEVKSQLAVLDGWSINPDGEITKTFTLASFPQALLFVNAVGRLAEAAQHHPDILIQWKRVILSLSTHDAGGLTQKDFDLALQIEALPK
jgi:4a-hydroxytetrahydrobiopterin dehydratase